MNNFTNVKRIEYYENGTVKSIDFCCNCQCDCKKYWWTTETTDKVLLPYTEKISLPQYVSPTVKISTGGCINNNSSGHYN